MEEIIKKAIYGGWNPRGVNMGISQNGWSSLESVINLVPKYEIICDPLFWKSLGKALGWGTTYWYIDDLGRKRKETPWKTNAIYFHQINLTEGWDNAVKYLENLIK